MLNRENLELTQKKKLFLASRFRALLNIFFYIKNRKNQSSQFNFDCIDLLTWFVGASIELKIRGNQFTEQIRVQMYRFWRIFLVYRILAVRKRANDQREILRQRMYIARRKSDDIRHHKFGNISPILLNHRIIKSIIYWYILNLINIKNTK